MLATILWTCSKKEELPDKITSYSGEAFILKSASIDTSKLIRKTILDSNAAFSAYHFKFPLRLELYFIKNIDLIYPSNPPRINYLTTDNTPIVLDSSQLQKKPKNQKTTENGSNYEQLIIFNTELDKDMMYYASTGFFLEQYINQYNGDHLTFGFTNTQGNTSFIKENLMAEFYEKTRDINTSSSIDPEYKYNEQEYYHIINSIEAGVKQLKNSSTTNKQLTFVNYSLVDPNTIDPSQLAELKNLMDSDTTITLNVISLFPLDYLQPITQKTGGFFESDITFIYDFSSFLNYPNDLKEIIDLQSFPSSYVIQNLNQIISGPNNRFQQYTVNCILTEEDITKSSKSLVIDKIIKEQFHIEWQPNKYMTVPHLYFKLATK